MPRWLTPKEASERLGLTQARVSQLGSELIRKPGTALVSETSVTEFAQARRARAIRQASDLEQLARLVAEQVRPLGVAAGAGAADQVGTLARTVFGEAAIRAAATPRAAGCRWCWARMSAEIHQTGITVEDTPAWRALFGTEPCERDMSEFRELGMERLRARVYADQVAARADLEARLEETRIREAKGAAMVKDAQRERENLVASGSPLPRVPGVSQAKVRAAYLARFESLLQLAESMGETERAGEIRAALGRIR